MTYNKPGTEFAIYALLFVVWILLRLNLWVFFGVMAFGWIINLWTRRWQLLALFRAARAPDDPMPDFMKPPR